MNAAKIILPIVILLALITGTGVYTARALAKSAEKLENHIVQIENGTKSGDWKLVKEELPKVKSYWSKTEKTWTMLLDHIEIDNIDNALTRMEKFIEVQNTPLALAEAAALKQYIKHIPEKESFRLKNIL